MRAQTILAGAGWVMIGAAGWIIFNQHYRAAAPPATPPYRLALTADHDGAAIRLHWDPRAPAVLAAGNARLRIVDGAHRSELQLDPSELRSGLARYWPESPRVEFRLETDRGASGSLEATSPKPALPQGAAIEAEPRPRATAAPNRAPLRVRKSRVASPRVAHEDADPPPQAKRGSRWSRLTRKIPWVRRPRRGTQP